MILTHGQVKQLGLRFLPFADAASDALSLSQLLRMSLFQITVGMGMVMLLGTLDRVMIVELGVPAMVVAFMIALPVLLAPFRALLGFKSDTYRSALGWCRVPYLWFGSMWQMGGFAVMPFGLLVLSGEQAVGPAWAGEVLAALSFLMAGFGLHMTQTAGLALAADRATEETRPRVIALLYVMFLIGMGVSALVVGVLLRDFSHERLVQVVQGVSLAGLLINLVALWKQEPVLPTSREERMRPKPKFCEAWTDLASGGHAGRLLAVVFLGTLAFNMQDVLLEPYGGEILGLSISTTTTLTALWAGGALLGFGLSANWLAQGYDPVRLAARGVLFGIAAFSAVIFSALISPPFLFFVGAGLIGFGGGIFAVATLTSAMTLPLRGIAGHGLALGAWGAAQATAAGLAIAAGGAIRDGVNVLAISGVLGDPLSGPATGYSVVYHIEIGLLFATLIALGPLVRLSFKRSSNPQTRTGKIGLADFPT